MSSQKKNRSASPVKIKNILALFLLTGVVFVYSITLLASSDANQVDERSEKELTKEEFIASIRPRAQEMQKAYGILPSIIIGQAILESNWGQSTLASEYNNLFGMKAYGEQKKVNLETQEFINEEWITIQGDFKVYDSWDASIDDHTQLFVNGVTWDPRLYQDVLLAQTYQEAAQALQDAGYATDPTYAEKIIHVIETYQLNQYD